MPGAPPDALFLVCDVALVRDLLALRAAIGLEIKAKRNQEPKFGIGGKYKFPVALVVFWVSQ